MTRKDYILIAKAITDTQSRINADESVRRDRGEHLEQLRGVRRVAAHLADALLLDNPRGFDPTMFLKNCGYGANDNRPTIRNRYEADESPED